MSQSESRPISIRQFYEISEAIQREARKIVIGQESLIHQLWVGMLAGGHVLLEGVPGLGKTLLVKTMASLLGSSFKRIQFTPDLMPADILGTMILHTSTDGNREFRFERGPIFANLVLADEINRAAPRSQAALLEAMEEGQVSLAGEIYQLPTPFFVLATQNPIEMEGTYPLPEAQVDRFLYKVNIPYPTEENLILIAQSTTGIALPELREIVSSATLLSMQHLARQVPVAENVYRYAARLVQATHPNHSLAPKAIQEHVRLGASPRGVQAITLAAKVETLLAGRRAVGVEEVVKVTAPSLRHRLILHYSSLGASVQVDDLIASLLREVPVP